MNIFHKVTMQNMLKNRTRTLVTIIGVIFVDCDDYGGCNLCYFVAKFYGERL